MTEKPNSLISELFSKYPLHRQLTLLMIIVFTVIGTILFISLSKLTQASIFHEIPMVEIEPSFSENSNNEFNNSYPNPTVVLDIESLQSAALYRLFPKLQNIFRWTITGGLIFGLILTSWLSTFISTPIKNLTHEISAFKNPDIRISTDTMPSRELSDLHFAIISSLERFERQFEMQNQFLLDVAHEFRTPVSNIRMRLDIDKKKKEISTEEFYSLCQTIDRSTIRLEQLLIKLKCLSKIDSQLRLKDVLIDNLLVDTIELLSPLAEACHIEVKILQRSNLCLRIEPLFVETIITNLIENAIRYNKPKGIINVSAVGVDNGCEIQIVDTGIGISGDEIGKVFNRFYRVDKARSRQSGGSGLGLSIVKELLNRLGGRISIQSELGVGTEVIVYIPNQLEKFKTDNYEKE